MPLMPPSGSATAHIAYIAAALHICKINLHGYGMYTSQTYTIASRNIFATPQGHRPCNALASSPGPPLVRGPGRRKYVM